MLVVTLSTLNLYSFGAVLHEIELLSNPQFLAKGKDWALTNADIITAKSSVSQLMLRLKGVNGNKNEFSSAAINARIDQNVRTVNFTCNVYCEKSGTPLFIRFTAMNSEKRIVQTKVLCRMSLHTDWNALAVKYTAPSGSSGLVIELLNRSENDMFLLKPSLKSILPVINQPQKIRIEVIKATAQVSILALDGAEQGTVTFPIPGIYRYQIPISFKIVSSPSNALVSYRLYSRSDGINWLCEAKVRPPDEGAIIKWESLVLVNENFKSEEPHHEGRKSDVKSWISNSACVQSDNPAIKSKSDQLFRNARNEEEFAKRVIEFTSLNRGKTGEKFDRLDALRALDCGGSCTSRANLAAALFRAQGIPARTVAHLPVWSGPLYEHWLVEYWNSKRGWTWIEPTLGNLEPSKKLIVLAVSSIEDEDKSFDPIHLRYVMPGAPYLSVCELSPHLISGNHFKNDSTNLALVAEHIEDIPQNINLLLCLAKERFQFLWGSNRSYLASEEVNAIDRSLQRGDIPGLMNTLRVRNRKVKN
ncbi:MAG: transglutaminase-like domain-containing protein [Candidatus Melainabacteria bacterium]|nr:transglutaminase-like domain-containing protein [Candidatus Melainabacteria bacterium]